MRASTDNRRAERLFSTEAGRKVYRLAKEAVLQYGMEEKLRAGTLVGFSGGADSVTLLLFLEKLREEIGDFSLALLHVNHGLRGAEADRDEAFSRRFAEEEGLPFYHAHIDVTAIAKARGESTETAARFARYHEYEKIISGRNDYHTVALAHNATDNLETVLFRILRGAGTHGGIGILPVRDEYVRPLLFVPKKRIFDALLSADIPFVTDSSNDDTDISRNYIRHEILPKLLKICPEPEVSARRFSQNLMTDDSYLSSVAEDVYAGYPDGRIPFSVFSKLHPAICARLLSRMSAEAGGRAPERTHMEAVIRCIQSGHPFRVALPGKVAFVFDGAECFIRRREERKLPALSLGRGENALPSFGYYAVLSDEKPTHFSFSNVYNFSTQANLGSAIIHGELRVRKKCDGDAYFYGGMTHRLKKLFASTGLSPGRRANIPVVVDDIGVVYVPGFGVRDDGGKTEGPYLTFVSVSEEGDLFLSRRQKPIDRPATERQNDRKV